MSTSEVDLLFPRSARCCNRIILDGLPCWKHCLVSSPMKAKPVTGSCIGQVRLLLVPEYGGSPSPTGNFLSLAHGKFQVIWAYSFQAAQCAFQMIWICFHRPHIYERGSNVSRAAGVVQVLLSVLEENEPSESDTSDDESYLPSASINILSPK